MFQTLILLAAISQAPTCQNGACQLLNQAIAGTIRVNNPPPTPTSIPQQMAPAKEEYVKGEPLKNVGRAIRNARRQAR